MAQIICITKGGATFILLSKKITDPEEIMHTVDHVDVHYTLGSERAETELRAHGIEKASEVITINL